MRAGRLGIPGLKSGTRGTQFLSPQIWARRVLISKNMSMLSARL